MRPTRRFILLAVPGLIPAALAAVHPLFFALALLYFGLALAFLFAVYLFGGDSSLLQVDREAPQRFSLDEWQTIRLNVRSLSNRPVEIEAVDTTPPGWEIRGLPLTGRIVPGEPVQFEYQVRPAARGETAFGDIYLRVTAPPWLVERQFRYEASARAAVYPDLKAISRYEALLRRSRLAELGIRRSRLAGRGSQFERIRDYTPDDEFRHVDWKATARLHRPMTRVYEVERSQQIILIVSTGRMMAGRLGRMTRLDYVINAAVLLAHVALKGGDRVGLMIVSDQLHTYIPPGKGEAHFGRILEALYLAQPRICQVDYRLAIEQIALRCKRRSLTIFFAEMLDDEVSDELVQYLPLLRPVHLPLCVALRDPMLDQETIAPVRSEEDLFRRAVAVELAGERQATLERLHRAGAALLESDPQALTGRLISRYLEIKYRQLL